MAYNSCQMPGPVGCIIRKTLSLSLSCIKFFLHPSVCRWHRRCFYLKFCQRRWRGQSSQGQLTDHEVGPPLPLHSPAPKHLLATFPGLGPALDLGATDRHEPQALLKPSPCDGVEFELTRAVHTGLCEMAGRWWELSSPEAWEEAAPITEQTVSWMG